MRQVLAMWHAFALPHAQPQFQNRETKQDALGLVAGAFASWPAFLNHVPASRAPAWDIPSNELDREVLAQGLASGLRRDLEKWA